MFKDYRCSVCEMNNINVETCVSCYKNLIKKYKKSKFIEPNHVIDNIYIGSEDSSNDKNYLMNNKFTHILVVGKSLNIYFPNDFCYMTLEIDDSLSENIKIHFEKAINFIKNASGKVLIHCASGISRSSTIVIAYLMNKYNMKYSDAYIFLKGKRNIINPNSNFISQLKLFESTLFDK